MTGVQQCVCGHAAGEHDVSVTGRLLGCDRCLCERFAGVLAEPVLSSLPSEIVMEDGTRVVSVCVCGHPFADHVDDRCAGYVPVEVDAHDPQCPCMVRVVSGPVVTITMTAVEWDDVLAGLDLAGRMSPPVVMERVGQIRRLLEERSDA